MFRQKVLYGVIQGDTIRLNEPSHLPTGTPVGVIVVPESKERAETLPPGEGLLRAFGAWKGDDEEELGAYLEWSRQQRKRET